MTVTRDEREGPRPASPAGSPGVSRQRLDRDLAEHGCSALLVLAEASGDPDAAAFLGPAHLHTCLLLVPRGRAPRLAYLSAMERDEAAATGLELVGPEELEVGTLARQQPTREAFLAALTARLLERSGIAPGRLALAGHGRAGVIASLARLLEAEGWTLVPGNELALVLRKRKDERQLAAARHAAAGAATALRRVAELLAAAGDHSDALWLEGERLTVGRLKLEVARALAPFELTQPAGNIIAPGGEGAVPHTTGNPQRVLRAGESLVVDLFPKGWLHADVTRTFCVGEPPPVLAAAHAVVLEVRERVGERLTRALAAGERLRAFSLQDSACGHFRRHGYPTPIDEPGTTTGYVHNLGHGVGFELHEYPSFRRQAGEEGVLEPGDLLTLEPGLYDPEAGWGVRIEDLVFLGPDGPENLTPLPYELDPRAW